MKAFILAAALALLACTGSAAAQIDASDVSRIGIDYGVDSLGLHHGGRIEIDHDATGFHADSAPVSAKAIDDLLIAIEEPTLAEPTLENLGMNRQWLEENALPKSGDYSGVTSSLKSATPQQLEAYKNAFADLPALGKLLASLYQSDVFDYLPAFFATITLKNGLQIRVESMSPHPGLLPWNITIAGKTVRTYNTHISAALDALAPGNQMLGRDPREGVLLRLSIIVFARIRSGTPDPAR